jgi:hypothetical protein
MVGNPKGKRPLGKLICRCVYDIERDLREKGCSALIWLSMETSEGLL